MRQRAGPLADATKVVTTGLLFWGGAQLASTVLNRSETFAVAVQASIAEWGAGAMGIAWSDPQRPVPSWNAIGRRVGYGLGLGLAVGGLTVGLALATRAATMQRATLSVSALAMGLIVGALGATRDELLLRGFVLRATRGVLGTWAAIVVCGGAAAAARLGLDGAVTLAVVVEALRGVALGAVWVRDRGAWMAVAANAAWTWTTGLFAHGALLDVRFQREPDASPLAIGVLALAAGAALAWTRQGASARTQPGPPHPG